MNRVEKFIYGKSYKLLCGATTTIVGLMSEYVPTYASSVDDVSNQVTKPMNDLIGVILNVLAVVGVFMMVKSIAELVNSIQQQDNSGIYHAGRGIAAAALMISIKLIIKLFGYDF